MLVPSLSNFRLHKKLNPWNGGSDKFPTLSSRISDFNTMYSVIIYIFGIYSSSSKVSYQIWAISVAIESLILQKEVGQFSITYLMYLYNNTMYSCNFIYIRNLLFKPEILVQYLSNLRGHKKMNPWKESTDNFPFVAHLILNSVKNLIQKLTSWLIMSYKKCM